MSPDNDLAPLVRPIAAAYRGCPILGDLFWQRFSNSERMAVERADSDPSVELLREALSRFPAQTAPAMLFASSLMANRLAAEKGELTSKSAQNAARNPFQPFHLAAPTRFCPRHIFPRV